MTSPTRPQPHQAVADILSTEHARKVADEVYDFLSRYQSGALTDVEILEILAGNNREGMANNSGLPDLIRQLRNDITEDIERDFLAGEDFSDWVKQLTLLEEELTEIGKATRARVASDVGDRLFPRGTRIIADQLRAAVRALRTALTQATTTPKPPHAPTACPTTSHPTRPHTTSTTSPPPSKPSTTTPPPAENENPPAASNQQAPQAPPRPRNHRSRHASRSGGTCRRTAVRNRAPILNKPSPSGPARKPQR